MFRSFLVGIALCALFITSCSTSQTATSPDALSSVVTPQDGVSPAEVARRMQETLDHAAALEMNGNVHQVVLEGRTDNIVSGLDPMTFHTWMAPGLLRSDIYNKSGALAVSFAMQNGRYQEYRPLLEYQPLIECIPPRAAGSGDTILNADTDCLISTQMESWVTRGSHWSEHFGDHIRQGRRVDDAVVDGRPCYVFRQHLDYGVDHVTYVDQDNYAVLRWDTFNQGIQRIRIFNTVILPAVPENVAWRITPGHEKQAANAAAAH